MLSRLEKLEARQIVDEAKMRESEWVPYISKPHGSKTHRKRVVQPCPRYSHVDAEQDENLVLFKIPAPLLLQRTEARKPCLLGVCKAFQTINMSPNDSRKREEHTRFLYSKIGSRRKVGIERVATAEGGRLSGCCGGYSFPLTVGLERGSSRTEPAAYSRLPPPLWNSKEYEHTDITCRASFEPSNIEPGGPYLTGDLPSSNST